MTKPGKVFLAGAGPGDPGLVTHKTRLLMQSCDVICYDLLIDQAVLALVPPEKKMLAVGYRGYCGAAIEYGMHPLVVEQALSGKSVLRLKAGDPLIFGRATEECRCLKHNGIEYEIIPGISSALGAAAYTGFPLTSNGMASDVTFASGHRVSETIRNWALMNNGSGTLVLYMGAKKLAGHAKNLMELGKSSETRVAVVAAATSFKQRVLQSTLGLVGQQIDEFDNGDPMLVILGDVVSLANELNWRDALPLTHQQVLTCTNNDKLTNKLSQLGATLVDAPKVEISYQFNQDQWAEILVSSTLWLDSKEAVLSLLNTARHQKLDIRHWHWALSGTGSAIEELAQAGIYTDTHDKHQDALILSAYEIDNALCGKQVNLFPPQFEIAPAGIAIVDEVVAATYLVEQNLLYKNALFISQNPRVVSYFNGIGYYCHLYEEGDDITSLLFEHGGRKNAA